MRSFVVALIALIAIAPAGAQQDAKPSPESIKQLFELMNTRSLLDTMRAQVDASAHTALTQRLAGGALNDEQRRIATDTQEKVQSLIREELGWAKLEPLMIEVYRDNLTQKEVDGMLKFYRSEAGKAFIAKMPGVTQEMMQKVQSHVQELVPQIRQLEKDSAERVQAAASAPSTAPAAPQPPQSSQPPPSH